jgi:hypothetical protein
MGVKRGFSLLGMLAMIVAGCSSTGAIDGPVLTSSAELFGPSGGMAAEVTGVLIYEEPTNCLLMELEGVQYPLVWPAGARWQEDPPAVVLDNGEKVAPGMTVYGGGGYLQREHIEELTGAAVAAAADRCAGPTGEIAFFNIESEVEVIAD